MPLSDLQRDILRALAAHRSPESYVAGSTPLHRDGPRFSGDIDIFHHHEEQVALTAEQDAAILTTKGFVIEWLRKEPGLYAAAVQRDDQSTKLEWVRDSDFRFYPAVADELFGYTLHWIDIATNKALAAAGRQVPRDVLDLIHIHDHLLPLGAVIWAAVGKDPGYSPESLIAEIQRNARYRADEYEALDMAAPIDAGSEFFEPTSIQVTSIDVGNPVTNLVPDSARAMLNIRFNERHTGASLAAWIRATVARYADRFNVDIAISGESFLTAPGPVVDSVCRAIAASTGQQPKLDTGGGTSDARFIAKFCPVAEFGLVGATMHQVDESVPVADLRALAGAYRAVLDAFFAV